MALPFPRDRDAADIIALIDQTKRLLERLILATPTSETRNALTSANIHLDCAETDMKQAIRNNPTGE
jgi:hypothetical protein